MLYSVILPQENYGVSVIECLQPVGEVPARSSTAIQFVFSPQEVKTYIVSDGGNEGQV